MRLIVAILGTVACSLLYTHRAGLSVAIVAMVKHESIHSNNNSGSCITTNRSSNEAIGSGEFEWSESLQGIILGSGYYMYVLTPTISGRITDMFGAKWLTAISIFSPAILSALSPIAAQFNVNLFIAIRVIIGVFHGCTYACLFSLYSNWFPSTERASAIAGLAFGANFGNAITFPLAGYLCEYGFADGWPSVFYTIALAHVPWLLLWIIFVEDSPQKSNSSGIIKVSDKELKYINSKIESTAVSKRTSSAPWISILTSKVVWASIIAKISAGWGYYLLLSKMPSYLDTVFGISIFANGVFNSMSTLASGVTQLIGGPLSGLIIKKSKLSKTRVRKIFEDIALIGPAICIALIPAFGCNSNAVIALLILAMLLYGFMTGGEYPIISEFAPDFSGTVFGVEATLSIFPAFVAPYVVGVLLDEKPGDMRQWNIVFYITVGFYILGAVVFELFASAEPQEWGVIKKSDINTQESDKS